MTYRNRIGFIGMWDRQEYDYGKRSEVWCGMCDKKKPGADVRELKKHFRKHHKKATPIGLVVKVGEEVLANVG